MAYIGKKVEETKLDNRTVDTITGDGSATTMSLSATPISVNNVLVFFNGVMQRPTTDYTLSGSTITFTTAPFNGAVVVAITGGGEHIGTPLYELEGYQFADNVITDDKIATGISASKLTGTKGAWDASAVTGIDGGVTKGTSDPTVSTTTTAGEIYLNKASGELYVCTDATAGANVWTNVGAGTGHVAVPSNPTNTGGFTSSHTESSSYTFTFSGATDADGNNVTHYVVDTISNAALTVASAEVAAGSAHTFNTGAVGSDVSGITFRVRAKDSSGRFSSGVTVTTAVTNTIYTTATGGIITTVGDYKFHTFNSSSTFTVSQVGSDNAMDFLVLAGGGGGGGANLNYVGAGAGGAGGYRSSLTSNGGGSGLDSSLTPQTYSIVVGAGQPGANSSTNHGTTGGDSKIGSTVVATGGGGGGTGRTGGGTWSGSGYANAGLTGGCGGGGSGGVGSDHPIDGGSSSSYGHDGGHGWGNSQGQGGGGGGGAGSVGANASSTGGNGGGNGGNGLAWVDGVSRGGGGGGGMYSGHIGTASHGGGAGGGNNGTANLGGGGGGANSQSGPSTGGNGGDGVVIIRYKYKN